MATLTEIEKKKNKLIKKQETIATQIAEIDAEAAKEAKDILLKAIITGTEFKIRNGSTAPYSTGYMIQSDHVVDHYCKTVTCQNTWWENIVNNLYEYLVKEKNWDAARFEALSKEVRIACDQLPTSYDKSAYGPDNSLHGHHIANGYENDGFKNIILGHCGGTWSSCTTCAQNDLARVLCVLRGFGADYYLEDGGRQLHIPIGLVEYMYRYIGILGEDENLDKDWVKAHPERCVLD